MADPLKRDLPFDPTDASLPRGLRRFGRQLSALQERLDASAAAPPAKASKARAPKAPPLTLRPQEHTVGHRLHAAGGRTPLFMLQGLGRVALGTGGDEAVFGSMLADVKVVEDHLGEVDFWWAFLQQADRLNLPRPLVAWAEGRHAFACGKLEGRLEAGQWVAHRHLPEDVAALRVHALGEALEALEWPGHKQERKQLTRFLAKRLRKVHEAALELDLDDLEQGVHELRRKLRWFSIYAACLDGAVALDHDAPAPRGWERYLTEAVVKNKFNQLPSDPDGREPVRCPAPLFYALSWIIAELGEVKDRAQLTETLDAGLRATGQAGSAQALLGKDAIGHAAAGRAARVMVERALVKDELLLRLAAAIEDQA